MNKGLFLFALTTILTFACAEDQMIRRGDVKILKPVPNCDTPDYFRCSFRDSSWFEWYCEHPNQGRLLAKELDKCQRLLRRPTDELVDTCRRAWMMQVWLTTEPDRRRTLARQVYHSMSAIMKTNDWNGKKVRRYLIPFKRVELDPSP